MSINKMSLGVRNSPPEEYKDRILTSNSINKETKVRNNKQTLGKY